MTGTIHFVIPHYGSSHYLEQAVDSVLTQDDPHWQLTIVEDGHHVDLDSPEWLERFSDERVRRETNPVRLGLPGNFQRALECAATEWTVFLGNDDVLSLDYVSTVRKAVARHPAEVDLIQPGVRVINEAGETVRPLTDRVKAALRPRSSGSLIGGEELAASLMHGNWLYFPSLCWRTERIRRIGFRRDLPTTLDLALVVAVLLEGGRLHLVEDVVFRYRRHASSASSTAASSQVRFQEERQLFDELTDAFARQGWGRAARAARWHVTSRVHHLLVLSRVGTRLGRSAA